MEEQPCALKHVENTNGIERMRHKRNTTTTDSALLFVPPPSETLGDPVLLVDERRESIAGATGRSGTATHSSLQGSSKARSAVNDVGTSSGSEVTFRVTLTCFSHNSNHMYAGQKATRCANFVDPGPTLVPATKQ